LYKERQALGCPSIPDGTDCKNVEGKAVIGSKVSVDMNQDEILNKINFAVDFENRWVKWRIFFIISVISALLIVYILHHRLISEQEILIYTTVLMLALIMTSNFYKFHLTDHIKNNVNEAIDILKTGYDKYKIYNDFTQKYWI